LKPGRREPYLIEERTLVVDEAALERLKQGPRILGVGLLIWRGESLLLIREDKEGRRDRWLMVGGALEPGEPPEQAARREALEEVGLRLSELRLAKLVRLRFRAGRRRVTKHFLIYEAKVPEGARIRRGSGVLEARWFKTLPRPLLFPEDFKGLI